MSKKDININAAKNQLDFHMAVINSPDTHGNCNDIIERETSPLCSSQYMYNPYCGASSYNSLSEKECSRAFNCVSPGSIDSGISSFNGAHHLITQSTRDPILRRCAPITF